MFDRADRDLVSLGAAFRAARRSQNMQAQLRVISHIASIQGRYDFLDHNLNALVNFAPIPFATWLETVWAGQV